MNSVPKSHWDRQEWVESVERALGRLVESVTAKRFHPPPLTNEQYRALGRAANHDAEARAVFDQYFPELNVSPSDLMDLLAEHPVIRRNCRGAGSDLATFVTMPSKGFRMELRNLARHLTRAAVRRGHRDTAAFVERFLSLSDANQVSGYEVAVFRGLTMELPRFRGQLVVWVDGVWCGCFLLSGERCDERVRRRERAGDARGASTARCPQATVRPHDRVSRSSLASGSPARNGVGACCRSPR